MIEMIDVPPIDEVPALPDAPNAQQLPTPQGYYILCAVPQAERTYESGLVKADMTVQRDEILAPVLFVMKLGSLAYKDEKKFSSGPWCKEGDFVIVRSNTGTRLKIHGREFRLITDDQVEAVVEDPRGIIRP